jgi:hypothetical protein
MKIHVGKFLFNRDFNLSLTYGFHVAFFPVDVQRSTAVSLQSK